MNLTSEQRSCQVKVRHQSEGGAAKALAVMLRLHPDQRGHLHIYLCRFCHGWHLGNTPRQMRAVRRLKQK